MLFKMKTKEEIKANGLRLAKKYVPKRRDFERCYNCYPFSENGTDFCRRKKGHKGSCSTIVYWGDYEVE